MRIAGKLQVEATRTLASQPADEFGLMQEVSVPGRCKRMMDVTGTGTDRRRRERRSGIAWSARAE